ncbi:probable inositol transporter 2, partial [Phoenix dactylifera]|uniref:Probable inositol transporter 2 n=1 Tax=Phoenix dactylifera TaxID=42345 RepID=A0A8B8Z8U5_PHODC
CCSSLNRLDGFIERFQFLACPRITIIAKYRSYAYYLRALLEAVSYKFQGREEEAESILRKIYQAHEVDGEIGELKESVEAEMKEEGSSEKIDLKKLLKTKTVRRGLIAGVGIQAFQQFVGINTVMYYSPTIVQLAGFASNQTALALSLITSGLNAIGTIISIYFIDRTGRKKLSIISLCGVIISIAVLSAVFYQATAHSPSVSRQETPHFAPYACPEYRSASAFSWDCTTCLKASSPGCGFCASGANKVIETHHKHLAWIPSIVPEFSYLLLPELSVCVLYLSSSDCSYFLEHV